MGQIVVSILGSSSDDIGYGVSVDSDDNILIADTEGSIDGFLNSGNSDVFLANIILLWINLSLQMGTSNHGMPQA